jgi:ERCC4-type nuclease
MRPLVRIDHREMHTPLARYFQTSSIEFDVVTLEAGDIEIGDRVLIERKRYSDLCRSIRDGRLFKQAHRIRACSPCPILLIEGEEGHLEMMHRNALNGALAMIAIESGVPALHTRDAKETLAVIELIANRERRISMRSALSLTARLKRMEEEACNMTLSTYSEFQRPGSGRILISEEKKCLDSVQKMLDGICEIESPTVAMNSKMNEAELRILRSFPGIGPKLSKRLLCNLNNLGTILDADEMTLCKAGLSPAVALRFRRMVSSTSD